MTDDLKKQLEETLAPVREELQENKKAYEAISETIEEKITKGIEQAKDNADGEMNEQTKKELAAFTEKFDTTAESLKSVNTRFDELETKLNGNKNPFEKKDESATAQITKAIEERADEWEQSCTNKTAFSIELVQKQGDMTGANTFTNDVAAPDRQDSIIYFDPDRDEHIRDIVPGGPTTSSTIDYIQETAYSDGTDVVAEGATKPQSDFDLTLQTANVRKIASYMRVTEEMLSDVPLLTSYITQRMTDKLRNDEDTQILYGDGTGQNISGISTNAQAYLTNEDLADSNVQRWDILRDAIRVARVDEYRANIILLHPADFATLELTKDTQGRYILPSILPGGVAPSVSRVPIMETTAVTEDDFFVGDFRRGGMLFDRMDSRIRFFEQDRDNVIKNLVTVVAEERIAFPIWRSNAFVYGDFSDALLAGTGA